MHHASFGWFFTCWIAGLNQASGALTLESAKPAIQERPGSRALSKPPGTQWDLWDVDTTSTTNFVLSWSWHSPAEFYNPPMDGVGARIHRPASGAVANSVEQLVQRRPIERHPPGSSPSPWPWRSGRLQGLGWNVTGVNAKITIAR